MWMSCSFHMKDVLHTTSVIRDFTSKCLLYVSRLPVMCMSRTQHWISFLSKNASENLFNHEAQASSEDQVAPECSLSFFTEQRDKSAAYWLMREHACWGISCQWPRGGRCSTVSTLYPASLCLQPTHTPCNSPITQWRMSRCCEILFLKMYLFEFIVM